jgi:hypothetical protein
MGIRFYCPNCDHKLNVKSFLAGKRGVCPQCGGGLDIPLESQIVKGAAAANDDAPSGGTCVDDLGGFAMPALPSKPADISRAPAEGSGTPHLGPPGAPAAWTSSSFSPRPVAAAPTVPTAAYAPKVPTAAPVMPSVPTTPVRQASVAPVSIPTPAQPVVQDPIDEAPEAVWYVRPPSGGQYGPARGDVMRKWIGEGRISADSMVWREGWDDWRSGAAVFPYLRAAVAAPLAAPAPVAYAPSAPAPAASTRSYAPRRQNSLALAVTTVVVLGLMSVALLIMLVWVINNS